MSKYVIITPAKNEESYIEKTIESVLSQTVRPSKWIIVDDASTDRTAEIVSKYRSGHIHLYEELGLYDVDNRFTSFELILALLQKRNGGTEAVSLPLGLNGSSWGP